MNVFDLLHLRRASSDGHQPHALGEDRVKREVEIRQSEMEARLSALEAEADIIVRRQREDH